MALAPPWQPGVMDESTGRITTRSGVTQQGPATTNKPITPSASGPSNKTTGATTGTNAGGMSAPTGWAGQQGFTPEMLADNIYDSPWWVLPYVFQGIDPSTPGYQALRDIGGDPMLIYNIMYGSNGLIPQESHGDYANFLNTLYSGLGTSGGQGINARQLLSMIFGNNDPDNSTLGQMLSLGDASQQSRTLYNMIRDVTNMGMNPLAATGYQGAMARNLDRYGSQMLSTDAGDTVSPLEWIRQNAPGLVVR